MQFQLKTDIFPLSIARFDRRSFTYIVVIQFVIWIERSDGEQRSEANWTGKWNHQLKRKSNRETVSHNESVLSYAEGVKGIGEPRISSKREELPSPEWITRRGRIDNLPLNVIRRIRLEQQQQQKGSPKD